MRESTNYSQVSFHVSAAQDFKATGSDNKHSKHKFTRNIKSITVKQQRTVCSRLSTFVVLLTDPEKHRLAKRNSIAPCTFLTTCNHFSMVLHILFSCDQTKDKHHKLLAFS